MPYNTQDMVFDVSVDWLNQFASTKEETEHLEKILQADRVISTASFFWFCFGLPGAYVIALPITAISLIAQGAFNDEFYRKTERLRASIEHEAIESPVAEKMQIVLTHNSYADRAVIFAKTIASKLSHTTDDLPGIDLRSFIDTLKSEKLLVRTYYLVKSNRSPEDIQEYLIKNAAIKQMIQDNPETLRALIDSLISCIHLNSPHIQEDIQLYNSIHFIMDTMRLIDRRENVFNKMTQMSITGVRSLYGKWQGYVTHPSNQTSTQTDPQVATMMTFFSGVIRQGANNLSALFSSNPTSTRGSNP